MGEPISKVVIVLPAFNEENSLARLLERLDASLRTKNVHYEIVIVDDGSDDQTASVALNYARRIPLKLIRHERNQGLGATIRDGLQTAILAAPSADVVIAMDADDTHSPALVATMAGLIRDGNDVVIASRYRSGSKVLGLSVGRRGLSIVGNAILKVLFPTKGVRDFTCGYRAYRASLLRQAFAEFGTAFVSEEGFSCMVDILLKLRTMNARFVEVPLILRYDLKQGKTKMRIGRTIRTTLSLILRRRLGFH